MWLDSRLRENDNIGGKGLPRIFTEVSGLLECCVIAKTPFVLSVSKHERGSPFDRLRTNGESLPRIFTDV